MAQIRDLKTGIKYKNTPIGKIPVDWEVGRLGDLCIGEPEYGANVPSMDKDNNLPRYVRITDITDNGKLLESTSQSINKESAQPYILGEGDFLFARSGATVGKSYLYSKKDGECAFAGYLIRFKPNSTQLLPEFLFYFTHSDYYYNWVKSILRAGAQPNINAKEYSNMLLTKPPIGEQKKIAEILTTVDETIEKTDQIIEKNKEIKKGLMQELLTRGIGHKKFKKSDIGEIPENWEVVNLGKMIYLQGGFAFKSNEYKEKGLPLVRISNVRSNGITLNECAYLPESFAEEFRNYLLKTGDVLVAMSGATTGKIGVVSNKDLPALFNQRVGRFVIKDSNLISKSFLTQVVLTKKFKENLLTDAAGGAQPNVSGKNIEKIVISLPPILEQKQIAEVLSSIDEETEKEGNNKEQLELLKKGLMQVLLTGKIRVSV